MTSVFVNWEAPDYDSFKALMGILFTKQSCFDSNDPERFVLMCRFFAWCVMEVPYAPVPSWNRKLIFAGQHGFRYMLDDLSKVTKKLSSPITLEVLKNYMEKVYYRYFDKIGRTIVYHHDDGTAHRAYVVLIHSCIQCNIKSPVLMSASLLSISISLDKKDMSSFPLLFL